MKIAIMSDFHLGFGAGTARGSESFENAKQALEIALEKGADAIIIAGDLFDSSVPQQETWDRCFETFSVLRSAGRPPVKISVTSRSGKQRSLEKRLPVIAIHGTHEFRTKDYTNALQVLETEGTLVYIHAATAELSLGGERVAIHGMGGVPEQKALDALRLWKPLPAGGAKNILVLHQSLKEFLPSDDPMVATLSIDDLPEGFDLVVNGHLHWPSETESNGKRILMPGSTIITQMKRLESEKPKGICIYDAGGNALEFFPLPRQRRLFYHKVEFRDVKPDEILGRARELLETAAGHKNEIPPLVRLKLSGSLSKGFTQGDVSLSGIENEFRDSAIVSIEKDFFSQDFRKKISDLREMHRSKQSIAGMGLSMLEKNLEEAKFGKGIDPRRLFELLADNKLDEAFEIVSRRRPKG